MKILNFFFIALLLLSINVSFAQTEKLKTYTSNNWDHWEYSLDWLAAY